MYELAEKTNNISIRYLDKKVDYTHYNEINNNILTDIFESDEKYNYMAYHGNYEMKAQLIVFIARLILKQNADMNILDFLNIDDLVLHDGKRGRYLGLEDFRGEEKIRIEFNNGSHLFNVSDAYKLSRYVGTSEKSSSLETRVNDKRLDIKNVMAKIINKSIGNMNFIISESMLVVIKGKKELHSFIEGTEVVLENANYSFAQIFPSRYWSSPENSIDLTGNLLKMNPIIHFVSNIDMARDLISNDKSIKTVLLFEEDIYKDRVDTDLEYILKRKSVEKIIIFNSFDKINSAKELLTSNFEFQVNAWTQSALLEKINLYGSRNTQNNILNSIINFLDKEITVTIPKETELISKKITLCRKLLQGLIHSEQVSEQFAKIAYTLIKIYEKSGVRIDKYNEYSSNVNIKYLTTEEIIKEIEEEMSINTMSNENKNLLLNTLKDLYTLLSIDEYKLNCVRKIVDEKKKSLIIVRTEIEKHILDKEFNFFNIDVIQLSKYKSKKLYDNIIFLGVLDWNKINGLAINDSKKINYIIYPSEVKQYNRMVKQLNQNYKEIEMQNKLSDDKSEKLVKELLYESSQPKEDINNDNHSIDLEDYLSNWYNNRQIINYDYEDVSSTVEIEKIIFFKTGEHAFVTKYFIANVLIKDDIKTRKLIDIDTDDELIFVNTSEKEENFAYEMIQKLLKDKGFYNQFNESYKLSKVWREKLEEYKEYNHLSFKELRKNLAYQGLKREEITIRNWMDINNSTAPRDLEAYEAIAHVTNDIFLLDNIDNVWNACNDIRKLHTKVVKSIASIIINASIDRNTSSDPYENLIREYMGDVEKYAMIVEVEKISSPPEGFKVPGYIANTLLEE